MKTGTAVHNRLEKEFKKDAEVMSLDEIISTSKETEVLSREFFVMSSKYGIRGFIDEIWLTPDGIMIIDDKPGNKAYYSMKTQIYAYALAYRDYIGDNRKITVGIRTRGTDNIFWQEEFTKENEDKIISLINHMQNLISGTDTFTPTDNPNKCRSCMFNKVCPSVNEF